MIKFSAMIDLKPHELKVLSFCTSTDVLTKHDQTALINVDITEFVQQSIAALLLSHAGS